MNKQERCQIICLLFTAVNTVLLLATMDNIYFLSGCIFAAAVFVVGAMEK